MLRCNGSSDLPQSGRDHRTLRVSYLPALTGDSSGQEEGGDQGRVGADEARGQQDHFEHLRPVGR